MASLETIRTITIQAKADGVDQTTAALKKLTEAQDNVAVVSDKATRSQLSAQSALERQQRSLDTNYRSTQQYGKAVADLERAHAQGLTTLDRHNQLMQLASDKYGQGSVTSKAFAAAIGGVQGQLVALSAGLGPVGVFLSGLGPAGLAAAIGIGAIEKGFIAVSNAAHEFAAKAKELREFAESTGLTASQLKGLEFEGAKVGVSSERVAEGIERMAGKLEEVRKASGAGFDTLYKYNSALALQLSSARSTADAIDILSKAFQNLDATQRLALGRALGLGRSPGDLIRVLGAAEQGGGVGAVSRPVDTGLLDSVTKMENDIREASKRSSEMLSKMFVEPTLAFERWIAKLKLGFAETLSDWQKKAREFGGSAWSWLTGRSPLQVTVGTAPQGPLQGGPAAPAVDPYAAERALNVWQKQNAVLGAAMTQTEQYKQKVLELSAAQEKDRFSNESRTRALNQFNLTQLQSNQSAKESLGISNEQAIAADRMLRLYEQEAKGLILTNDQRATAVAIIQKEARASAESAQIRASSLPGLTSMRLEWANFNKQVDQFATTSATNVVTALADITSHTATAGDAFRNLGLQVLRTLEEMLIKMALAQVAAVALRSALGGAPLSLGNPGGGGGILGGQFHGGGVVGVDSVPGRYVHPAYFEMAPRLHSGLMGDEFPAILQRGETVIPRGGAGSVNITNNYDFRGADPGSEARIKAYVDASSHATLIAAVRAVAAQRSNNPSYLRH